MTQQFHEGQKVEVYYPFSRSNEATWPWCKALIVTALCNKDDPENNRYEIQFPDGWHAVVDAERIRTIDSPSRAAAKKVAHEFGERLMGRHP